MPLFACFTGQVICHRAYPGREMSTALDVTESKDSGALPCCQVSPFLLSSSHEYKGNPTQIHIDLSALCSIWFRDFYLQLWEISMNDPKYAYPYPSQGMFSDLIFVSYISGESLLFSLHLALIHRSTGNDASRSCPRLHAFAKFCPHGSLFYMARTLFLLWDLGTILSYIHQIWKLFNQDRMLCPEFSSDVTCSISSFYKPRFANHRLVFYYSPLPRASSDGTTAVRASSVCPSAVRASTSCTSAERTQLYWRMVRLLNILNFTLFNLSCWSKFNWIRSSWGSLAALCCCCLLDECCCDPSVICVC